MRVEPRGAGVRARLSLTLLGVPTGWRGPASLREHSSLHWPPLVGEASAGERGGLVRARVVLCSTRLRTTSLHFSRKSKKDRATDTTTPAALSGSHRTQLLPGTGPYMIMNKLLAQLCPHGAAVRPSPLHGCCFFGHFLDVTGSKEMAKPCGCENYCPASPKLWEQARFVWGIHIRVPCNMATRYSAAKRGLARP